MADVELVIKLTKENYKNIVDQVDKRDYPDMRTGKAIVNGKLYRLETVTEFADRCRECGKQKTAHWILADVEYNRVYHCNCSECGKDPMDYIRGSENWWLIKNRLPKYCPNCGRRMVNPQKSEVSK